MNFEETAIAHAKQIKNEGAASYAKAVAHLAVYAKAALAECAAEMECKPEELDVAELLEGTFEEVVDDVAKVMAAL